MSISHAKSPAAMSVVLDLFNNYDTQDISGELLNVLGQGNFEDFEQSGDPFLDGVLYGATCALSPDTWWVVSSGGVLLLKVPSEADVVKSLTQVQTNLAATYAAASAQAAQGAHGIPGIPNTSPSAPFGGVVPGQQVVQTAPAPKEKPPELKITSKAASSGFDSFLDNLDE